MRRDIGLDSGLLAVLFNQFPEALAAHGLAVAVGKQPIRVFALQKLRPGLPHVLDQGLAGVLPKGHHPLLAAVPAGNVTHLHVHIRQFQADQLRHADSGGVEQFQHRLVPKLLGCSVSGLAQQRVNLIHRQDHRRLFLHLGSLDKLRRIAADSPLPQFIVEKCLNGSQLPRNRGGGFPLLLQIQYVRIQAGLGHLFRLRDPLGLQVSRQLHQISLVGNDRILRCLFFILKVPDKVFYVGRHRFYPLTPNIHKLRIYIVLTIIISTFFDKIKHIFPTLRPFST